MAEDISNLRYDSLTLLFRELSKKLGKDAMDDLLKRQRPKLSHQLLESSNYMTNVANKIEAAWKICEPYMKTKKK